MFDFVQLLLTHSAHSKENTLMKFNEILLRKYRSPSVKKKRNNALIVIGLTIIYILIFLSLVDRAGPILSVFLALPVLAAGWFFGRSVGVLAGVFGFLLNLVLLGINKFSLGDIVSFWPGYLAIIATGFLGGFVHDKFIIRNRIEVEVDFRERFIVLLSIATKSVTGTDTPEEAYYRLVSHLTNLFIADYAYLIQWNEPSEQAILVAATKSIDKQFSPMPLEPGETHLIEKVLRSRTPQVIEDVQRSSGVINPAPFDHLNGNSKSALIIPLCTNDYCFGAATLAFDTTRSFSPEELVYVELAGNQIALALRTVQQQLAIENQLRESKALAKIERALSESERVGVDSVLDLIVNSAIELIPKAKRVILHLIDERNNLLVPRAVAGYKEKIKRSLNMQLGKGIAGQVMATRKMMSIADVNSDPQFLRQDSPVSFRSLVVVPILIKNKAIGTISIQSDTPNAFTLPEVTLLETLGTQVAIGIDNANLLESIQLNLKEINILYKISQELAASLDSDQLMKTVVDLMQDNFGYHLITILLVDPDSGDMVARQGSGKVIKRLVEEGFRIPAGEGIVGHVVSTGESYVANDVDNVGFYLQHPLLPNIKCEMTVPIMIGDHAVGVIDVQETSRAHSPERQLSLLSAVADQLAIALHRIDILDSLEERIQHRTHDLVRLYNLVTFISENWRLEDILELSLVLTLEAVNANKGIIYLTNESDGQTLEPVVQRGFGPDFEVAQEQMPDNDLAREVFAKQKSITVDPLKEWPGSESYNGSSCYAGIPILARDKVLGVFSIYARNSGVFGSEQMALLASIADHISIGIEKSALLEKSRETAALEERNRLAMNLHDSVSQLLYSLTLMAGTTKKMLELDHDPEKVKSSVSRLGDTAHQALKEMRLLLYELRPAVLDSEGLAAALEYRIETVEERLGIKVNLQTSELPDLPKRMEDGLYHIALEAFNNIAKHSESSSADIKFSRSNGNLIMEITDEGLGFDAGQDHKGLGLRNIRERCQTLGGKLEILSSPQKGTKIKFTVKIPSEDQAEK